MNLKHCTNAHIVGSTLVAMLILAQTICGKFTNDNGLWATLANGSLLVSWGWLFLAVLPIYFFYVKSGGRGSAPPRTDWMSFLASGMYPMLLLATLFLEPMSSMFQRDWLIMSVLWVLPAQILTMTMTRASLE